MGLTLKKCVHNLTIEGKGKSELVTSNGAVNIRNIQLF